MQVGLLPADARQMAVGEAFARKGWNVCWLKIGEPLPELIVLPMPVSENGITMYGSDERLEDWWAYLRGKTVYGGRISLDLQQQAAEYNVRLLDHFDREEEVILNVIPTVEGALELAMAHTDFTLHGSAVLVCGFGRIGKLLAHHLQALGAKVCVSARKERDFAWCKALGYDYCHNAELPLVAPRQQLIFNTVPHLLFDKQILACLPDQTLLIDLASKPGGVDYKSVGGKRVLQALGLPGKVAPRTAGEIICETILGMYKEENTRVR
ncbi:MAG: dipicolinate synthase subunit DpsA [Clostridia bacterium]|nr:dipicolinate synthase subunit DpsA [Clostridia bacterium]